MSFRHSRFYSKLVIARARAFVFISLCTLPLVLRSTRYLVSRCCVSECSPLLRVLFRFLLTFILILSTHSHNNLIARHKNIQCSNSFRNPKKSMRWSPIFVPPLGPRVSLANNRKFICTFRFRVLRSYAHSHHHPKINRIAGWMVLRLQTPDLPRAWANNLALPTTSQLLNDKPALSCHTDNLSKCQTSGFFCQRATFAFPWHCVLAWPAACDLCKEEGDYPINQSIFTRDGQPRAPNSSSWTYSEGREVARDSFKVSQVSCPLVLRLGVADTHNYGCDNQARLLRVDFGTDRSGKLRRSLYLSGVCGGCHLMSKS